MAAEGLLRDPALFRQEEEDGPAPDRLALFAEYCALSEAFFAAGGWAGLAVMDATFAGEDGGGGGGGDETSSSSSSSAGRQKQVDVARAHLQWMLEKRGHGRTVRFTHLGPYRKHVNLLNALRHSTTMDHLVSIAKECLGGVHESRLVDVLS